MMRSLLLVTLALIAVACRTAVVDPHSGDPCKLLTNDQIAAAMGEQVVGDPRRVDGGDARDCIWNLSSGGLSSVTVTIFPDGAFSLMRSAADPSLPGIGSDAYWDATNGFNVAVDGVTLNVLAYGSTADSQTAATALARIAAALL